MGGLLMEVRMQRTPKMAGNRREVAVSVGDLLRGRSFQNQPGRFGLTDGEHGTVALPI
jgi:hypothetical protein